MMMMHCDWMWWAQFVCCLGAITLTVRGLMRFDAIAFVQSIIPIKYFDRVLYALFGVSACYHLWMLFCK